MAARAHGPLVGGGATVHPDESGLAASGREPPPGWTKLFRRMMGGHFISLSGKVATNCSLKEQMSQEHTNMALVSALMLALCTDAFVNAGTVAQDAQLTWAKDNPDVATSIVRFMMLMALSAQMLCLFMSICLLLITNEMSERQIRMWSDIIPPGVEMASYRLMIAGVVIWATDIAIWNAFCVKWWWVIASLAAWPCVVYTGYSTLVALKYQDATMRMAECMGTQMSVDQIVAWARDAKGCPELQAMAPEFERHRISGSTLQRMSEDQIASLNPELELFGPRMEVMRRVEMLFDRVYE